ncbi:hypothetical protein HanIR_Chr08g0376151 [Helianthus annuus]|nr:hypothetical protein HanIR_Chr08g0376151 [Helianthus annuus]
MFESKNGFDADCRLIPVENLRADNVIKTKEKIDKLNSYYLTLQYIDEHSYNPKAHK